ncbi:MAG: holo-ACP synthase [Candidatus Puniceispirillaceae bacterium]
MIVGVGNDICNIDRIDKAYQRHGDKFAVKILTPAEQDIFARHPQKIAYLAKRFAAKEAIYKAIQAHIVPPPSWQDAEILNDEAGRPIVRLSTRCQQALDGYANAPVTLSLSLSDDTPFAFAVCIASA